MDAHQARAENLAKLLCRHPSLRVFADQTRLSPAHVSQMKNGVRRMGDEVARRIEARLRLPHGWMDHPHTDQDDQGSAALTPPPLDQLLLRASPLARQTVEGIIQAAAEGRLNEADLELVDRLASHLAMAPGKRGRPRRKAKDERPL